ncbi:MAG: glycosyl transferase [Bacteroidales bacterium]|nr:glycosyl transferase [Bacteroidales bacterium]
MHAYLILAHAHFAQLRTLLRLLDDGRNDIFVHVDARAKDFRQQDFEGVCRKSRLQFIEPRIAVHWGGVSIMRAELALLRAALPGHYRYYHLLSGMDLPLKTQDEIHAWFEAHDGKEFIQCWKMKKSTPSRFRYYTLFPEGAGRFGTNLLNNIFKGLQMALGIRINRQVDFRFASQWFSITDGLARYVVEQEPWLEKVFAHTNTCDEIFLPTLLARSPFRDALFEPGLSQAGTVNLANLRFIDWSRGESVRHPWTFRLEDKDLLLSTPHFWARKFDDAVDDAIIEEISDYLLKPIGNTHDQA